MTFFGCDTEENLPENDRHESVKSFDGMNDPFLVEFLKKNHMQDESVVESREAYLIGGDIVVSKEKLKNDEYGTSWIKNKEQSHAIQSHAIQSLVNSSPYAYRTIKIKFSSNIPSTATYLNWRNATAAAIAEYNNIRNLRLKFEIVTAGTYDILITSGPHPVFGNLPENAIAAADPPSGGNTGTAIAINPNYFDQNNVNESIKKFNLVHELGHSIGFRHTNYQQLNEGSATYVVGTWDNDLTSVMNGGTAEFSWNGFGHWDVLAFRTIYPYDNGQKPLYTYRNSNESSFWSENWIG